MSEDLRYPVGRFTHAGEISAEQREVWIRDLERLPSQLAAAVSGLTEEQLDTPYREGGWTVRQVAHHLADSHMNSVIRFKLALTEEAPVIKPYDENAWAQLADSNRAPVEEAVKLVEALHRRWVILLRGMTDADFAKTFYHPANQKHHRLDVMLGLYAWHSRHHVAHIRALRDRNGWTGAAAETAENRQNLERFESWIPYVRSLASLPVELAERPLGEGKWSVRDVVAHIWKWDEFFWEHAVARVVRGEPVTCYHMDYNAFNEQAKTECRKLDWPFVAEQSAKARERLALAVRSVREEEYGREFRDADGHSFTLRAYLEDFASHDAHHRKQIEAVLSA